MLKHVVLTLVALTMILSSGLAQTPLANPNTMIGKSIPTLPIQQWVTSSATVSGKWMVLEVWATWCGYCDRMIPRLNSIQKTLGDKVAIVAVSNENLELIKAHVQEQEMTYPVAQIAPGIVGKTFGVEVSGVPFVFLVDPQGIVRWTGTPNYDNDSLLEYLRQVTH
jgi:thiol-disulfide isomerase/thioredoxin